MRFLAKHRRVITLAAAAVMIACLIFLGLKTGDVKKIKTDSSVYAGTAMGTAIKKTIYAQDSSSLDEVNNLIDKRLRDLENQISIRVNDSEVTMFNRNHSPNGNYDLSHNIYSYLEKEMEICEETDGAFNPCIRPLTGLWGIEEGNTNIPSEKEIKSTLEYINPDNMKLTKNGVICSEDYMLIDFGAVGKGIACDEVRTVLNESGVQGAVVSIGGSICVYGDKGDGKLWHIGIQDPRAADGEVLGIVDVPGTVTVSTSGDYEKYFEADGVRYHHILDPKTGYPADSGLISVTVISDSGFMSDALSTACFVLGLEKGMEYANKKEVDAIFVTEDKEVYITEGLKKKFRLTGDGYCLEKYK